ncbi:MAG: GNAT family N-acetyltransferase [Pseudomonadota bacterium]
MTTMQQHPLYGRACSAMGVEVRHYQWEFGGDLSGAAQVLIRRWPLVGGIALLSRGPLWAPEVPQADRVAATRVLVRQLRSNMRGVLATPEIDAGPDPLARTEMLRMVSSGHVARLDLREGKIARRGRMHGKWRNRLAKAEAEGLQITRTALPTDPNHWLLRAEADQARARRYKRLPIAFTTRWASCGGKTAGQVFTVMRNGNPIAAMLILSHGSCASYHIGWSGPEGRRLNAHSLALWHASNWCAGKGLQHIDLGTLDTETSPGLARFKLGCGAQPVLLGATWLDAPGTRLAARLTALGRSESRPYASSSASQ